MVSALVKTTSPWLAGMIAFALVGSSEAMTNDQETHFVDSGPVLSGTEVLNRLGGGRVFCYGFYAAEQSCGWTREITQRSATQVSLVEARVYRTDRCRGRLFCDPAALDRARAAGFEGIIFERRYTLDIDPTGLCQRKQQALADAARARVWYASLDLSTGSGASPVEMPESEQKFYLDRLSQSVQGEVEGRRCWVYREPLPSWGPEASLSEEILIDGFPDRGEHIYRDYSFISRSKAVSSLRHE